MTMRYNCRWPTTVESATSRTGSWPARSLSSRSLTALDYAARPSMRREATDVIGKLLGQRKPPTQNSPRTTAGNPEPGERDPATLYPMRVLTGDAERARTVDLLRDRQAL